jgi:hypothetical protein
MSAAKRRNDKPYQPQGRYPRRYRFDSEGFLRRDRREQEERRAAAEARLFIGPLRNPRDHFADLDLVEVCTTPAHPRWDEVMLYIERFNAHAPKSTR